MWFKVDDSFPQHPKVLAIPRPDRAATIGLWAMAGIWCSQQLTDGYLAEHMVEELAGQKKHAELLVKVRLWQKVEGGYQIHDYLDYNPSSEEVRADQARKHEAKVKAGRAGGVASGAARRKHARSSNEADAKQNGSKTKPRPDPTRSEPKDNSSEGVSHASSGSPNDPPLYPDRCKRHGDMYEPPNCGACADVRKSRLRLASIGPHNPAKRPHCGECDPTRMLRTRFGSIPCPNCNPAAEAS